jgi:hypothetical protein
MDGAAPILPFRPLEPTLEDTPSKAPRTASKRLGRPPVTRATTEEVNALRREIAREVFYEVFGAIELRLESHVGVRELLLRLAEKLDPET